MKIETLNLKLDMPPTDVAIAYLEQMIDIFKKENVEIVKVIHGYGSHGKGGEIKKGVKKLLFLLMHFGKIKNFVCGENWGTEVIEENKIYEKYPELLFDADLKNYNSGITIVFI